MTKVNSETDSMYHFLIDLEPNEISFLLFDKLGTERYSVWFQINQKIVNTIWFWFDLMGFRKDLSALVAFFYCHQNRTVPSRWRVKSACIWTLIICRYRVSWIRKPNAVCIGNIWILMFTCNKIINQMLYVLETSIS